MVVHDINMSEMAFSLGLQQRMVGVTGISGWYKTTSEFDERRGSIPELAPKYPTLEPSSRETRSFLRWLVLRHATGGEATPETLARTGSRHRS